MKRRAILPWGICGVLGLALFSVVTNRGNQSVEVPTVPVLQRLRDLGELHTARFEYSDVVDHGTYQKPEGILAAFPGADAVARATTGNKALIDVRGSVEAGVDLRKMATENTPTGIKVVLPPPHTYSPQVDARLFSVKRGLLWRDDSVTLGAVSEAKNRLAQAALQQGILTRAKEQAVSRVRGLAESFGVKITDIRFAEL